jgi:hypothetical protein
MVGCSKDKHVFTRQAWGTRRTPAGCATAADATSLTNSQTNLLFCHIHPMDMASFTWSDTLRACLPCLQSTPSNEGPSLQALLADGGANSDVETDAMSLHSQLGSGRRRIRQRQPKSLRFMGWDLFGRRKGPIALPEDDESAAAPPPARTRTISATSDSLLDPDAAPLDADAVSRMTREELEAAVREAERHAKEERRARRRERRELRRGSISLNLEGSNGASAHDGLAPYTDSLSPLSGTMSPGSKTYAHPNILPDRYTDHDDADLEDFDASAYTRKARGGTSASGGSETRSRSSASGEPAAGYNHHYISQREPSATTASTASDSTAPKSRRRKSHSSRTKTGTSKSSASASTAQESASLASPREGEFPQQPMLRILSPSSGDDFEGFPGGNAELADTHASAGFPSSTPSPAESFPSARIGFGRKTSRADAGVALAWRGE